MQLHNIKRRVANRKKPTIGRGGTRGKTSGRGTKGQKARSGHKMRPEMRDLIKKLPKLRGRGVNGLRTIQTKPAVVSLIALSAAFKDGDKVSPAILLAKGLIRKTKGAMPAVKILATGEIDKKLNVYECSLSKEAASKIEKAGGKIL